WDSKTIGNLLKGTDEPTFKTFFDAPKPGAYRWVHEDKTRSPIQIVPGEWNDNPDPNLKPMDAVLKRLKADPFFSTGSVSALITLIKSWAARSSRPPSAWNMIPIMTALRSAQDLAQSSSIPSTLKDSPLYPMLQALYNPEKIPGTNETTSSMYLYNL